MKIELVNCFADIVCFDISESVLNKMDFAMYKIISGDEVLIIYDKKGNSTRFDSDKHFRYLHYEEDEIVLHNADEIKLINELTKPKSNTDKEFYTYDRALQLINKLGINEGEE